jgi:hypothetical protein
MNQRHASIPCACGRGRIFSGENRKYNARNSLGHQVCADCKLEDILLNIRNPNGKALLQHRGSNL